jgi:hypothetical protein
VYNEDASTSYQVLADFLEGQSNAGVIRVFPEGAGKDGRRPQEKFTGEDHSIRNSGQDKNWEERWRM